MGPWCPHFLRCCIAFPLLNLDGCHWLLVVRPPPLICTLQLCGKSQSKPTNQSTRRKGSTNLSFQWCRSGTFVIILAFRRFVQLEIVALTIIKGRNSSP